ncbi:MULTISPECIES: ABC transporter ATP-binding protein [unclassified Rhizobium]|uniref:ABC transporter ATP-binding protein n=1 Tax=unclassified Rhizobium TaxID=2613769 RepID=UPI001780845C|nr:MULTISPECIES: oligopeptide/dipeptide ABC transporter ATP-binding protein [unclassified Rhizobium]MBD8687289.1 ATP-binding cassette domain-containing protein [Rhizobium sp. CFBP 13644]MBD8691743.1 ATP-binding cassette domain-containing protein [Rhizobium sp. CFBP 13717]
MTQAPIVIEAKNLSKTFGGHQSLLLKTGRRLGIPLKQPSVVHAVDGVNLQIRRGEVLGLVGESGCGKSTLGRMLAGITPPSNGEIHLNGENPYALSAKKARSALLRVQMIFQNPYASLNPRHRVAQIIGQAPHLHGLVRRSELEDYVDLQMKRCGLDTAFKRRFPHQFSGGQRQRVGIARALAVNPEVVICDEAVAALDVSIQAQIINLFVDLQSELGLTYLFISHDLGVVRHLSDRVAIMYLGRIVEQGTKTDIFERANHPYTQALLSQIPRMDRRSTKFPSIKGEIPSPLAPPPGCHFHPRCVHAMDICRRSVPPLREIAPGHLGACHLNDIPNAPSQQPLNKRTV